MVLQFNILLIIYKLLSVEVHKEKQEGADWKVLPRVMVSHFYSIYDLR